MNAQSAVSAGGLASPRTALEAIGFRQSVFSRSTVVLLGVLAVLAVGVALDRKSTRLNSSHI